MINGLAITAGATAINPVLGASLKLIYGLDDGSGSKNFDNATSCVTSVLKENGTDVPKLATDGLSVCGKFVENMVNYYKQTLKTNDTATRYAAQLFRDTILISQLLIQKYSRQWWTGNTGALPDCIWMDIHWQIKVIMTMIRKLEILSESMMLLWLILIIIH